MMVFIMKKAVINLMLLICLCLGALSMQGCSRVDAGYVGVKVNLLGSNKGVDSEVLGVGRYWIGINEELYLFPVFKQTVEWKNPDPRQGAIQFQSREGLSLSADVSMSYTINASKVSTLFQTYRRGIDEITSLYLYNLVRDTLVKKAATRVAENIYGGAEKNKFIQEVTEEVTAKMKPVGIDIDYIAIVGNVYLPQQVKEAIDAKVKAGQLAAQRETEVATAKAEADKAVAAAEGEARSKKAIADANAYAIIKEAEAQKQANELLSKSITPNLIEYKKIEKWNGVMPSVMNGTDGGAIMLQIPKQ